MPAPPIRPFLPTASRLLHRVLAGALLLLSLALTIRPLAAQCPSEWLPGDGFDMRGSTGPSEGNAFAVLPNGDLVVGGEFNKVGGQAIANVARWNGSTWSAMGALGPVSALVVLPNGDLVAGGAWSGGVSRWDGSTWSLLGGGLPQHFSGKVWSLVVLPNGDLVAGGDFQAYSSAPSYIARWDGSTWSGFPSFYYGPQPVYALAVHNGALVAGTRGSQYWFAVVQAWDGLAWTVLGVMTLSGASFTFPYVDELTVLPDGNLVASGQFEYVNGVSGPVSNAAQWDGSAWAPSAFGGVLAVLPSGNVTNGYAQWDGSSWSPMGLYAFAVNALAVLPNGMLVAGGRFTQAGDFEATGIARWGCPIGFASNAVVGKGCYLYAESFYEQFSAPPAAFDLSNSTIQMTLSGTGYAVDHTAGAPSFFAPVSADLGLGDDEVTPPIALPFNIPYPGGTTNQIVVGSNGYVLLQPASDPWAFYDNIAGMLLGQPRLAALWGDLDPGTGTGSGTVHVDIDSANQVVYATWMNVQEFAAPGNLSTFQIAMSATGAIEYRYEACAVAAQPALTGWSPGGWVGDPGSRDLSASAPFETAVWTEPLTQNAITRPVLDTNWMLETSYISTSAVLGLEVLGLSNPNIPDLDFLGAPECGLYAALDILGAFLPAGPAHAWSFAIPNDAQLIGVHLYATSVVWEIPAVNAFGAISANGIDGTIGNP